MMKIIIPVVAILLIFAGCSYVKGKKRSQISTMNQFLTDAVPIGKRIIRLTQMSEEEVKQAVDGFISNYSKGGDVIERPTIEKVDVCYYLTFKDGLDYDLFCFWINYLTYSDKNKRHNEDVTGWFEVSSQAKGAWEPFAGQQLMFFVPATDKEFDNVFFMTSDNTCYKQVFSGNGSLIIQEYKQRKYTTCPLR